MRAAASFRLVSQVLLRGSEGFSSSFPSDLPEFSEALRRPLGFCILEKHRSAVGFLLPSLEFVIVSRFSTRHSEIGPASVCESLVFPPLLMAGRERSVGVFSFPCFSPSAVRARLENLELLASFRLPYFYFFVLYSTFASVMDANRWVAFVLLFDFAFVGLPFV